MLLHCCRSFNILHCTLLYINNSIPFPPLVIRKWAFTVLHSKRPFKSYLCFQSTAPCWCHAVTMETDIHVPCVRINVLMKQLFKSLCSYIYYTCMIKKNTINGIITNVIQLSEDVVTLPCCNVYKVILNYGSRKRSILPTHSWTVSHTTDRRRKVSLEISTALLLSLPSLTLSSWLSLCLRGWWIAAVVVC